MGGKIVLPEPDENITKVIKNFRFTPKDISDFWKVFQKLDKKKNGLVSIDDIFKSVHLRRNLFTDCLLELLEIEHDGELNFSDFLLMVTTYCFFETPEILKFCFRVFDEDKTGFFSVEDLNHLMNMVHDIKSPNIVTGNVKISWTKLTFSGDTLSFDEFIKIHTAFPRLFEPAFKLQMQFMEGFQGEIWWNKKKRLNQNIKETADEIIFKQKEKKLKKKLLKKNRKIQRNMGLIKYYFCPMLRHLYDPSLSEYDKLSEEERIKKDEEIVKLRRQQVLKIKNPETAQWQNFKKKAEANQNPVEYIETKLITTERPREERALSRAERKQSRMNDATLKHKERRTITGADI